jgi:rhodanese-related sulfurtransferase
MTPPELALRLRQSPAPQLLDVRQPEENSWAALPESVLIPLGELAERWQEIADWQDREVVVYCHHGVRSAQAVAFLRGVGFRNLHNLSGGIDRWSLEVDSNVARY